MTYLKFIFLGLIGLYILIGIGVYFFQEKLIFLPEELPQDYKFNFPESFEEQMLEMSDGAKINLLHFKSDSSKGLILYFHGNAGSLRRWGDVVSPFVNSGYDVMIMDYRGYGKSIGKRSKKRLLSDADELYEYALRFAHEKELIVFGRSLGTSFASHLAGKNNPKNLILETPFYSLGDVAKNVLPMYPQSLLLRFNFKNYASLKNVKCPVYIFHGTEDQVVPLESGQKLIKTLDPNNSRFVLIPDGEHNNLAEFDEYWESMKNILNE